jgi:hypothetical protein
MLHDHQGMYVCAQLKAKLVEKDDLAIESSHDRDERIKLNN